MRLRDQGRGGFFTIKGDAVQLRVKVIPGANTNAMIGVRAGELIVKVKARAEKGKANRELMSTLAKWAKVPKRDVVILTGEHSRRKIVSLPLAAAGILRDFSAAGNER